MTSRRTTLALGAAFLAAPALVGLTRPAFAASDNDAPRANPMPDTLRRDLERDPNAPVLGNPQGDVTLTEFFDYNCGFCRGMAPVMREVMAADPNLRVAMREWPVFGEGSVFAARAALASMQQGRYAQMHRALMSMRGQADEASVMRIAGEVGLDPDRLRQDMGSDAVAEHIDRSMELADHMALIGTPTFIAGDEAVFGQNSLQELQELIARGRTALG